MDTDEKEKEARRLLKEVQEDRNIELIQTILPARKKLKGTIWKYRNCYSCPETDSDYWRVYRKVISVSEDASLECLEVQIDKYDNLFVKNNSLPFYCYNKELGFDGWSRAGGTEWKKIITKAKQKLENI